MKISKYICFILLSAANIAVSVKCWGFLQISYVPRLLIALSICCGFLILTDVKSKSLFVTIHIILSVAMFVGFIYAIYWRRPLGFWIVISAATVMAKYFLSEPKSRKDGIVMKMMAVTVSVTIFIITVFLGAFAVASDKQPLINGPETMWDSDSQAVFDQICIEASTDKEIVIAAYNWIINHVTQFNVCNEKVYLSPVMDLFNKEIVSYSISLSPNLWQIREMLDGLFKKLPPDARPIFHSDQGWQYQHAEYQRLLAEHNITQSMSRKGNCMDNGAMENFFGRLKVEMFYGEKFKSVTAFIDELKNYIHYYNNERISTKLNGMSPVGYRTHSLTT